MDSAIRALVEEAYENLPSLPTTPRVRLTRSRAEPGTTNRTERYVPWRESQIPVDLRIFWRYRDGPHPTFATDAEGWKFRQLVRLQHGAFVNASSWARKERQLTGVGRFHELRCVRRDAAPFYKRYRAYTHALEVLVTHAIEPDPTSDEEDEDQSEEESGQESGQGNAQESEEQGEDEEDEEDP
ncbi:unnamed protein product [Peniophora sp. CBMAI 1063]|nr:unnamed protein product [Peniophora sp. CBMAI 1063]